MRRLVALSSLLLGSAVMSAAAPAAPTADLCVGGSRAASPRSRPRSTRPRTATRSGSAPGTFAGGITIDKSVSLVGVSAGATTIEGGGPVITIGDRHRRPTVSISAVTITGGFNDSKPESQFGPGFFTAGGGVLIPAAADHTIGATVTIADSVISGNRVTAGPPQPVCGTPVLVCERRRHRELGDADRDDTRASTATSPAPRPRAAGLRPTPGAGGSGTPAWAW